MPTKMMVKTVKVRWGAACTRWGCSPAPTTPTDIPTPVPTIIPACSTPMATTPTTGPILTCTCNKLQPRGRQATLVIVIPPHLTHGPMPKLKASLVIHPKNSRRPPNPSHNLNQPKKSSNISPNLKRKCPGLDSQFSPDQLSYQL